MYAGIVAMLVRASRAHSYSKVEHVGLSQWHCSFRECRVRIEPASIQARIMHSSVVEALAGCQFKS